MGISVFGNCLVMWPGQFHPRFLLAGCISVMLELVPTSMANLLYCYLVFLWLVLKHSLGVQLAL